MKIVLKIKFLKDRTIHETELHLAKYTFIYLIYPCLLKQIPNLSLIGIYYKCRYGILKTKKEFRC